MDPRYSARALLYGRGEEVTMGKRLLKLPRRLFGYQSASVDQLIADRDSMLTVADQRVRSAESRIAELEEELRRREEDLEAVKRPDVAGSNGAPAHQAAELEQPIDRDHDEEYSMAEPPALTSQWIPPADLSGPEPETDIDPSQTEFEDEVDGWPLPAIRPRTVDFQAPVEPSADFDPMPIGADDRGWSTEPDEPWRLESRSDGSDSEEGFEASAAETGQIAVEEAAPEFEDHSESSKLPSTDEDHSEAEAEAEGEVHDESSDERDESVGPPAFTPEYMTEELATVVKAAEESATKIIERAWESTQTQISQVDRLWREVQEEIIRFATWREHVEPMIGAVQTYIDEARARIELVPERIQEALEPAVEAMAFVDEGMSQFADASSLPQLLGRLHAEVTKAMDKGEFTGSSSATAQAAEEGQVAGNSSPDQDHETAEHGHEIDAQHDQDSGETEPSPAEVSSNGSTGGSEGEDIDIARAIAQEIRVINVEQESDEGAVRAPESY